MKRALFVCQSAGDFLRWNSCNFCRAEIAKEFATGKLHHFHALVLEGGFAEEGRFVYLPVSDTTKMSELFRRLVNKALSGEETDK